MATQGLVSPYTTILQPVPRRKTVFGMAVRVNNQIPVRKSTKLLQIRSSIKNLVFEDRATGIICYKDEQGEIVCEGLDEGPRLLQPHPPTPHQLSDAEILHHLQKRCLQIKDGQTANDNTLLEDHRVNGLNALH